MNEYNLTADGREQLESNVSQAGDMSGEDNLEGDLDTAEPASGLEETETVYGEAGISSAEPIIVHNIYVQNNGMGYFSSAIESRLASGEVKKAQDYARKLLDYVSEARSLENTYQLQLDAEKDEIASMRDKENLTPEEGARLTNLQNHEKLARERLNIERAKTDEFEARAKKVLGIESS